MCYNPKVMKKDFFEGAKDSIPIVLGYLSVSFTFGIMAAGFGISPFAAGLMSLTNLTSAGQFAGLNLIASGTTVIEMFLTQFVINLRYALMSLTLTQNLDSSMDTKRRMLGSFFITDEIFSMGAVRKTPVNLTYLLGIGLPSQLAWVTGTVLGVVANNLLPVRIQSALGISLYGMFVALVIPTAKLKKSVMTVVIISMTISLTLYFAPGLNRISSGFAIIICTILASMIGAFLFPDAGEKNPDDNVEEAS